MNQINVTPDVLPHGFQDPMLMSLGKIKNAIEGLEKSGNKAATSFLSGILYARVSLLSAGVDLDNFEEMLTEKVAVHTVGWLSPKGRSLSHSEFHVYAGGKPVGPRGGRCGVTVSGRKINPTRFSRREDAVAFAKEYAAKTGAILVGEEGKKI